MFSKWAKRIGIGVLIVALVAAAGFVLWTRANRYEASPAATAVPAGVAPRAWRVFEPSQPTDTGFIFYPGGLVDVDAYGWIGPALAERGIMTVIVPMPLDLAILDPSEAEAVLKRYPEIKRWAIGGHSLGGAMAGQFLSNHRADAGGLVEGLALWGARLSGGIDISGLPVNVVSVFGTQDGVAPKDLTDAQRRAGLPANATLTPIEGGNHSMFGDYGLQKGDNPLAIPIEEARAQIISATLSVFDTPASVAK